MKSFRKIFALFFIIYIVLYNNISLIFAEEKKSDIKENKTKPSDDQQEQFVYDSHGKKDPFAPPKINVVEDTGADVLSVIRLEGIIWDEDSPIAVINGKVVGVSDEVNGAKIIQIKQNEVILEINGQRTPLKLQTKLD